MGTKIKEIRSQIQNSGFTLIELLVVISIIAILATLLIARKSDLRNIQTALRLYYNDYGMYPGDYEYKINGCGIGGLRTCEWGGSFASDKNTYMSILPADPSPDRSYTYDRNNTANDLYTLSACLENVSDDRCAGVCSGGIDGCTYLVQP